MKTAHRSTPPQAPPTPQMRWGVCGLSVLLALCLLGTPNAWAVLGGAVTPVAASATTKTTPDAVQLRSAGSSSSTNANANANASASALYSVHSTALDTGTTVQEYAAPGGVVFAVAWQGPVLPRLDTLLGNYFSAFTTGVNATRSHRSVGTPLVVDSAQLVVRSSGRMGHFSGHAYAPSLVPAGVTLGDVFP